jgi:hypothetical protein
MHFVPFFDTNSTVMFLWWPDWPVLVISRIYIYVYAFCTVFWHKFHLFLWWLDWPVFGNFIYIYAFCTVLWCEFNCNYHGCLCSAQNDLFGFITIEHKWDVYMFLFASVYLGGGPLLYMVGMSPLFYSFYIHTSEFSQRFYNRLVKCY